MNTQTTTPQAPAVPYAPVEYVAYEIECHGGWHYVVDPRTGNKSRPFMTLIDARAHIVSLRIRNLMHG